MKRVVLVINDLKGNGAERVVINLATELVEQGHECAIVCFVDKRELPIPASIPVFIFPAERYRWIPRSLRGRILAPLFDAFVKRKLGGEPNLVLSNLAPSDRILAHSSLPNVHFIIHNTTSVEVKTYFGNKWKKELNERLGWYRRKPCIGVSSGVAEDLQKLLPDHSDISYIYNPIDVSAAQRQSAEPLEELGEFIIHVGKFNNAKRHDRLLKAYAESGVETPLFLLGQGANMEKSKLLADELGVAPKVRFLGFRSNPYPYIKRAKFMVLASDFEGLPTVILEALALETPVVSTDCPSGPREMLPPTNLVAVEEVRALSQIIREIDEEPQRFVSPLNEKFTPEYVARAYLERAR